MPTDDNVIYLMDRRLWSSLMAAWQAGLPSRCPDGLNLEEWRASARRLAKQVECTVRTGLQERDGHQVAVAVANDGFPLGLIDAHERDAWQRHQAGE